MSERPGTDPDRADVKAVLAGDAEAFGGIVQRWQAPLVTLAYRYCRNRGQAEEMAQEAFLRAYRFLNRWKEDAPSLDFPGSIATPWSCSTSTTWT